jgi:hypothetical protein
VAFTTVLVMETPWPQSVVEVVLPVSVRVEFQQPLLVKVGELELREGTEVEDLEIVAVVLLVWRRRC